MIAIITTLLIVLLPGTLLAEGYPRMTRLSVEQGLSQSMVYSTFQDHEGFLWFGTREGLNRYDGYRFMTFRHDPFDTTSLPWTCVSRIAEDTAGNIWLAYSDGLCRFDRRTYRFARVEYRRELGTVCALQGDRSGNIWVGSEHGLLRYDARSRRSTRFVTDSCNPAGLSGDSITSLYEDRAGTLWIGTNGRYLHRYNPGRGDFTRFDPGVPNGRNVFCGGEDSKGNIFTISACGFNSFITGFDRTSGAVMQSFFKPGKRFYSHVGSTEVMCVDAADGLWVQITMLERPKNRVDRTTLYRIPLRGEAREELVFQTPGDHPIGRQIFDMLSDRAGILWVGTENGVVKMTLDGLRFRTFRNIPGDAASLSNDRVRGIHKDRAGTLWVGTDDGLNRLDPGSRRWIRYMSGTWRGRTVSYKVNAFLENTDGGLLLGTNSGISLYDRRTNTITNVDSAKRTPIPVWSFCRDSSGILWVGTRAEGLFQYDRALHQARHFVPRPNDSTTIAPGLVWDMHCDRCGVLWIATSAGLYRWLPERGIFRRYGNISADTHSLSDENVCAILEDAAGVLWFSTYGGGLNRYDPGTDGFTHITTRDGLPSDAIYGALMDRSGKLWISSSTGLAAYDPSTRNCRTYNVSDGLQGNEFSFKAFHQADNGEILFGGVNGLTVFNPDSLSQSREDAPMVITEFRVLDAIVRRELSEGDTVEIAYNQDFISFEFALLDHANPAGIRYAYRLIGFDKDWINCGDRRYAGFTNLDPGTYTFVVNGRNGDGAWSTRPLHIVVNVMPPFWMTWWFKASSLMAVLTAGVAGMMLRVRSVRDREILQRRGVESQLQALRFQVNPHFIFNTLSSIQHLILIAERERAVEYLSRFAQLVRAVLENSERTSIPLADEIANLRNYLHLEMFRFEGRFHYAIDVDAGLDIHHVSIPTMLIQPCVENAIRHGLLHKPGAGRLAIAISGRDELIHCSITDDGVGRQRAMQLRPTHGRRRQSMGIRVTEERLKILNAVSIRRTPISMEITDLYDDRGTPAGTRVELFIPMEFT